MTANASNGLLALNATLQNQRQDDNGIEGIIQAGSYNPADGTVQVVKCHTVAAAAFTDAAGNQIYPLVVGAQLETHGYGDQYGPVGGERCILRRAGTHYTAVLEHNEDDSPGAPSGERWTVHRGPPVDGQPGPIIGWQKFTNDGAVPGDGKAGYRVLAGGLASLATTGGISFSLSDTTHEALLSGAAELMMSVTGGASIGMSGTAISLNGAVVGLADGVARQSDLVALQAAIMAAISTWASTSLQGGSGTSGPTLTYVPTASSLVYSA